MASRLATAIAPAGDPSLSPDALLHPVIPDWVLNLRLWRYSISALLGKRVGPELEVRDGGRIALSALDMPNNSLLVASP